MNAVSHTVFLPDEFATAALAQALAAAFSDGLSPPLVLWLEGGLGAGKTSFARSLLRALGFAGAVKSPTYTIAESYPLPQFPLHHFALYRFSSPEEWEDAGLDDLASDGAICLIEWPDKGGAYTPPPDITLALGHADGGRNARLYSHTTHGRKSLEAWIRNLPAAK